jgi:murein L,D-transpeptidase YcbB/YkuD
MRRIFAGLIVVTVAGLMLPILPLAMAETIACPPGAAFNTQTGQPCTSVSTIVQTSQCLNLIRELRQGARGTDVTQLQQFLRTQGDFTYPTNTGNIGSVTVTAIQKFQRRNGISPVGYVGAITRAKIKQLSCTGSGGTSASSGA